MVGSSIGKQPAGVTAEVARVLAGDASYDSLPSAEQAVVRACWSERIDRARRELRFDSDTGPSLDDDHGD